MWECSVPQLFKKGRQDGPSDPQKSNGTLRVRLTRQTGWAKARVSRTAESPLADSQTYKWFVSKWAVLQCYCLMQVMLITGKEGVVWKTMTTPRVLKLKRFYGTKTQFFLKRCSSDFTNWTKNMRFMTVIEIVERNTYFLGTKYNVTMPT